jgi:TolB-like protein
MQVSAFRQLTVRALVLAIPLTLVAQDKEIRALTNTVADSLHKSSRKTVAVVDFTDLQTNVTELVRYLAEEVSVDLAGTGVGLEVVDRGHLKALLQENKLAATGVIDPATARRVGQIAGVEILVTGTITPFGDSVRFSIKALDAATGRILTASSTEIPKTRAIEELLGRGVAGGRSEQGSRLGTEQLKPTVLAIEDREMRFTLEPCKVSGAVTCNMTVLNESANDRDLGFNEGRLIDGQGQQIGMTVVSIGGQKRQGATFVAGVSTRVQLRFEGFASNVSSIALLEMNWHDHVPDTGADINFVVKFRNVPIADH